MQFRSLLTVVWIILSTPEKVEDCAYARELHSSVCNENTELLESFGALTRERLNEVFKKC